MTIREDGGGSEFAGERQFDVAILALRQAQGEGAFVDWTAITGRFARADGPKHFTSSPPNTRILSLSKDEDGDAEMASAVTGAILTASVGHRSPTGALLP